MAPGGPLGWGSLFPILGVVGIVPLIVYQHPVVLTGFEASRWIGLAEDRDLFSCVRAMWLCLFAGTGMALFFFQGRRYCQTWFNVPLFLFAVLAILSTMFSETPGPTLWGAPGRYEGLFVLLSYVGTCFLCINQANDRASVKWLLGVLMAASCVIAIVGIAQFLGHDPFQTQWGKELILPFRDHDRAPFLQFSAGAGSMFGTFPNPNNLGSFVPMVLLVLSGVIFLPGVPRKLWLVLLFLLQFVVLSGSRSKAGMLGLGCGCLGLLVIGRRRLKGRLGLLAGLGLGMVAVLFAMDFATLRLESARRLFDDFSTRRISHAQSLPPDFENVVLASDSVEVIYRTNRIRVEQRDGAFIFRNAKGEGVPFELKGSEIVFPPGEFHGILVKIATEARILQIKRLEQRVHVKYTPDGFRFLDALGREQILRPVEKWGFSGNDRWGNGRGFIWSRTLPLLRDTLFLGFGADMFLYHFPQTDFLGLLRADYPIGLFIDKPHNLYLQIAVNTGVTSLLVLLILFGAYLGQSVRLYWTASFEDWRESVGLCLAMAVFSYLVAGVFNDSVVSVAPVFWALLGTGIGVNRSLEAEPAGPREG
ncbi:MAG: O-antigen ligase family protein [Candidatus Riflebacteria bacterium]|nr:O-antigen ligase family protein [Candidatus Riflebacteria bacterium]